ncbi:P-loop containing nucleoside triphosphate hydrolase protein [Dichotomocladium elegans]|nr:P-loop containing nucleoside triphosphate hydrolase protein [Dichotomocladium elegans]
MAKGLRVISERLNNVDLVIEVRDARIPLSSVNPNFERIVGKKHRLIVYNKFDLADPSTKQPVQRALQQLGTPVMFSSCQNDQDIRGILRYAAALADPIPQLNLMIVGMPNVGKSSLINALRRVGVNKGKAAATGNQPGVTRNVIGTVKVMEHPAIYLIDTPGVMVPHIADPVRSLRVALTGGIRDHLADEQVMADYLLFELNKRNASEAYTSFYNMPEPTNDVHTLLHAVAKRIGAVVKGGEYDYTTASKFLLKQYRQGKLGRFTLDDTNPDTLQHFFQKAQTPNLMSSGELSRRQEKKLLKLERRKEERRANNNNKSNSNYNKQDFDD